MRRPFYTLSNLTCTLVSGGLTCVINTPAIPGSDVYSVSTYDAAQTSSAPVTPLGHLLSTATVPVTVVAGQANTLTTPLVLNGVAQTVTTAFAATDPHISGSTVAGYTIVGNASYNLTFTAQDASGATIVGAGAPTLTSASSALAVTQINATTYTVQVKQFSATPIMVTVSPALGSAPGIAFTPVQELWVANAALANVTAYALFPGAPVSIASDTITASLSAPAALAFDASGNLWVADSTNGTVTQYVPGTNSVVATISSGLLNPAGLAFDASGNLWVADLQNALIAEYLPANMTSPHATITSGLLAPVGVAFDASGNLLVSDSSNSNVAAYAPAGGSAPIATIANSISSPAGITFDAAGNLYVANRGANNVVPYVPANGAAPIAGDTIAVGPSSRGAPSSGTNSVAIAP